MIPGITWKYFTSSSTTSKSNLYKLVLINLHKKPYDRLELMQIKQSK